MSGSATVLLQVQKPRSGTYNIWQMILDIGTSRKKYRGGTPSNAAVNKGWLASTVDACKKNQGWLGMPLPLPFHTTSDISP